MIKLYHGSSVDLEVGDYIKPSTLYMGKLVYATTLKWMAALFSLPEWTIMVPVKYNKKWFIVETTPHTLKGKRGFVYEIEPKGFHHNPRHLLGKDEMTKPGKAKILKKEQVDIYEFVRKHCEVILYDESMRILKRPSLNPEYAMLELIGYARNRMGTAQCPGSEVIHRFVYPWKYPVVPVGPRTSSRKTHDGIGNFECVEYTYRGSTILCPLVIEDTYRLVPILTTLTKQEAIQTALRTGDYLDGKFPEFFAKHFRNLWSKSTHDYLKKGLKFSLYIPSHWKVDGTEFKLDSSIKAVMVPENIDDRIISPAHVDLSEYVNHPVRRYKCKTRTIIIGSKMIAMLKKFGYSIRV